MVTTVSVYLVTVVMDVSVRIWMSVWRVHTCAPLQPTVQTLTGDTPVNVYQDSPEMDTTANVSE